MDLFCKEVARYVFNRCVDENVCTMPVNCFMEEFFHAMMRESREHTFSELLKFLHCDPFLDETFQRYKAVVTY